MKRAILLLITIWVLGSISLQAQEEKKWYINGYAKNMQSLLFFNDAYPDLQQFKLVDTLLMEQLFHVRLNAEWYIHQNWTIKGSLRNRLIIGDLVRANTQYLELLEEGADDVIDMTISGQRSSLIGISTLDRLYAEYSSGDWEVRIGRQRINWGINTFWNPNDVFNAFSFTDFDYEERPGSDALRVKYYTGISSSLELAVKAFEKKEEAVAAAMWKFNQKGYDFQLMTGYVKEDWVVGGGWAGAIKNAGVKGEFSYFLPLKEGEDSAFSIALSADYSFKNSLYLQLGGLYNSLGNDGGAGAEILTFQLSAKNLYPYKWTTYIQGSYPLTPLINTGLSLIYSPVENHALFINPVMTYSIKENWDIDLVGQIVLGKQTKYKSDIQVAFLRLKYSF